MSTILKSKKIRIVLYILGGLAILFVVFGFGIAVGYQRAGFAMGFDKNYYRNFIGGTRVAVMPGEPIGSTSLPVPVAIHGIVGKVIDLSSSTLSVTDQQGDEQSVAVSSDTDIRNGDGSVLIDDIDVGDVIAVIGAPNGGGQIDARFIRILSVASSQPLAPQSQ